MASSIITTLLPVFVVYILHEGVDKLGIVIAVATFVSYIFRILFGYLSDKLHIVKPFVVAGYLVSAITKPLLAFASAYFSVALLRGAERMGKAVRSASKDSLISSFVKEKKHGKTFGFHKMMDISGELAGALIVFLFFLFFTKDESAIRTLFLFTAFPGVLAVLIALFFVKDAPYKEKKEQIVFNKDDRQLFPVLFIYFGFVFFVVSEQFLIVKAREEGYGLEVIPLFIVVFALIQALISYHIGIMSDRFGVKKTLIVAFLSAIAALAFVKITIWGSFLFLGIFTVTSLNSIRAYISKYSISKGFLFGVYYGGVAVFASLGALAVGCIWENYGFDALFIFSMTGMAAMLLFLLFYKVPAYKEKQN